MPTLNHPYSQGNLSINKTRFGVGIEFNSLGIKLSLDDFSEKEAIAFLQEAIREIKGQKKTGPKKKV